MNFSDFKNSSSLLSNEQMKNVIGGKMQGGCGYLNSGGTWIEIAWGGPTQTEAMMRASEQKTYRWCCDSCSWNQ